MGALREPKLLKLEVRTPQITGLYSKSATTSLSNICYNCIGRCLMKDVTIGLCNDFRTYILKIRVKQTGNIISRNSAAGYWSTFRALLKLAYKEGWLRENVNDYLGILS